MTIDRTTRFAASGGGRSDLPRCYSLVLRVIRYQDTRLKRECGKPQVMLSADPSLVSYRHSVGYCRSPGNSASLVTRSIGECRMSLWSAIVVKHLPHGDRLASSILPSTSVARSGSAQLRLSLPDRVSRTHRRRRGLLSFPHGGLPLLHRSQPPLSEPHQTPHSLMPGPRHSDSLRIAKQQDRLPSPCTRSVGVP